MIGGSREVATLPVSRRLDTRGMVCPYPAFETSKLLASSTVSEDGEADVALEIVSDDEYTATKSIPTVLVARGFDYVVLAEDDDTVVEETLLESHDNDESNSNKENRKKNKKKLFVVRAASRKSKKKNN
jgi:TusA-related sulfurtransferase